MGISPIPKMREGISVAEMTWNERFYYCLQKPFWFIAGIVIFGILVFAYSVSGMLADLLDVAVLFIWGLGVVYLPVALPVAIIYATVKGFTKSKTD